MLPAAHLVVQVVLVLLVLVLLVSVGLDSRCRETACPVGPSVRCRGMAAPDRLPVTVLPDPKCSTAIHLGSRGV